MEKLAELTDKQVARLDLLHNEIYALIVAVNPNKKNINWDMEIIGKVSDVIENYFVKNKVCTAKKFAPYVTRE